MTRTTAREIAVQLCYAITLNDEDVALTVDLFLNPEYYRTLESEHPIFKDAPDPIQEDYIRRLVLGVADKQSELQAYIEKYSKNWKLGRISKTAVAVLKVSLFEILYMEDVPNSASINEAVELSKGYDDADTVSFINGILGSFVRNELSDSDFPFEDVSVPLDVSENTAAAEDLL